MAYYMLRTGELDIKLRLSKIDMLAFLLSAMCHDLGHDGFTNGYHINAITNRAIDFNDVSVQESFHVAETFRILNNNNFNIVSPLTKDEFKIFRKNCIGMILATDMAKH